MRKRRTKSRRTPWRSKPGVFGLFGLLLACAAMSFGQEISPQAMQQIRELMSDKQARTAVQRKISSHLLYANRQFRGQNITASVHSFPGLVESLHADARGAVRVDISAQVTPALLNDITAQGAQILSTYPAYDLVQARVPLAAMERIANLSGVRHIDPTRPPTTSRSSSAALAARPGLDRDAVTLRHQLAPFSLRRLVSSIDIGMLAGPDSTGDVAHQANLVRSMYGIDGSGAKVGVISDGVTSYALERAAGRLPTVTILPGQGNVGPGPCPSPPGHPDACPDEGTAMLEIVYTLAPGAQLFFATVGNSEAQMATNILALRNAGCDIIVDDVTFAAESAFQDGPIAQAVTTVVNAGALYFSAAGNSGSFDRGWPGIWEGDFANSHTPISWLTSLPLHKFGAENNDRLTADTREPVTLQWSDPLGKSCNDYDLLILNATLTDVVDGSATDQDCTGNAFEMTSSPRLAGERIVVVQYSGASRALRVDTWGAALGGRTLAVATFGSTFGHNAAALAFTVGAVHVPTYGAFTGGAANPGESYSSDGVRRLFYYPDGTPITPGNVLFGTNGGLVLNKPDTTAADCVPTGLPPPFNPFCGTSAAAPHAAAIAALVKQARPDITRAQMFTILASTALDIEAPGYDRNSGYGIAMALPAVQSVANPPDLVVTSLTGTSSGTIGGLISIAVTAQNVGSRNAGPFRIGFYFSPDPNISTSDTSSTWKCDFLSVLAPGQSWQCRGPIAVPATLSPGMYYLGAIVDNLNAVIESNETNNARVADSGPITVGLSGSPDLTIRKSHNGSFVVGTTGVYALTVSNAAGAAASAGTITVTDTLPGGLSYVSATGTGWTCTASGQIVSCTSANSLAGGTSSVITLTVAVGTTAYPGVTNTAGVAGGGDTSPANNSASDATGIVNARVPELIWQNEATRQVTVNYYSMSGMTPSLTGWAWLNSSGIPGWHVVGAADFDGNGVPDLVWMNDSTRQVTVNYYIVNGGIPLYNGWAWLNSGGIPGWSVVALADVDGNGVPDLIWQNDTTHQVTVNYYTLNNGLPQYAGWAWLNSTGFSGWTVAGMADYDGNGVPDLVWMNTGTRQVTVNYYSNSNGAPLLTGWAWLNSIGIPGWHVVGVSDYDGNGVPDLVWENDTTHQMTVNCYSLSGGLPLYVTWGWLNSSGIPGWNPVVPR